jgi:phosphatidate cytidylyltransferase
LRLRVLSALVLLPLGLGCLWVGGWAWVALVALGSVGLAVEFAVMCGGPSARTARLALPATALAAAALAAGGVAWAGLVILALAAVLVGWDGGRIAPVLGVPYVGLTAIALIWLRADLVAGRGNVLFLLLVVWATDISAYVVGRMIGGPKLAPNISPGKTWSGAVGGLAGAAVVGWVAAPGVFGLTAAAALSVVAQAGDLMESGIKRHFGVKDSGKLIPGHGGLLDRMDGVLTAAPVMALLALAMGRGVGFWR